MEFGYKFKSALFGFSKKDVMRCIRELNESHQEELVELEEEGRAAAAKQQEAEQKLSNTSEALVELKRQLEENQTKNTALETVVRRLVENRNDNEAEISQLKQRITAQNNQNGELVLKNNELERKLREANEKVRRYDELTKDISDIMLEAQKMSTRLRDDAEKEAAGILADAHRSSAKVRADLDVFRTRVAEISRSLEQLTESLHAEVGKIETSLGEVNDSVEALGVPPAEPSLFEKAPQPVKRAPESTPSRRGSVDFFGKFREWLK